MNFHNRRIHCIFLLFHAFSLVVHAQSISQLKDSEYYKLGPGLSRPMVIIVVVLIIFFFFMVFLSIYLRHYVESRGVPVRRAAERYRSCHGLDPAVIQSFPVIRHSAIKSGKRSLECAVCLSEFRDLEMLRLLPKCDHIFHPNCIDAWLASRATCPVCRAKLMPGHDEDKPVAGSVDSSEGNSSSGTEEARDRDHQHVMIDIDESDRIGDDVEEAGKRSPEIRGKFPRSHSTGHSLVQPEEETGKCTLRVTEEQKNAKLKRSASYDVVLFIVDTN